MRSEKWWVTVARDPGAIVADRLRLHLDDLRAPPGRAARRRARTDRGSQRGRQPPRRSGRSPRSSAPGSISAQTRPHRGRRARRCTFRRPRSPPIGQSWAARRVGRGALSRAFGTGLGGGRALRRLLRGLDRPDRASRELAARSRVPGTSSERVAAPDELRSADVARPRVLEPPHAATDSVTSNATTRSTPALTWVVPTVDRPDMRWIGSRKSVVSGARGDHAPLTHN